MNFLNTLDPVVLGFFILALVVLILLMTLYMLHRRLQRFLLGTSENIDDSLKTAEASILELQTFRSELESYLATVEKRLRKSLQSVETVRFNPFQGVGAGGNQSFAVSFLSQDGDGVIISSLYSRDHVSVFAKAVKKHSSEHELSNEESQALKLAEEGAKR